MKGTLLIVAAAGLSLLAVAQEAREQTGRTIYTSTCSTAGCHASNPLNDRGGTPPRNRIQTCARPNGDIDNAVSCLLEANMIYGGVMANAIGTLNDTQLNTLAAYINSVFFPIVPVCAVSASSTGPTIGTSLTLTASCTNSPTSYAWTNCTGTTATCTATSAAAGNRTYSVTATNANGTSAPASVTVTWITPGAPPPPPPPPPPTPEPPPVAPPTTTTVVEYFHQQFGHYFITSFAAEIDALDSGRFVGWARTGRTFKAYSESNGYVMPVCRFFTEAFAPKSSHFYTSNSAECSSLRAGSRDWRYEADSFWVQLADEALGSCPTGTQAVYRLYNNGQSGAPNHRYTTDPGVRADMLGRGWIPEGFGPEGVGFCAPL